MIRFHKTKNLQITIKTKQNRNRDRKEEKCSSSQSMRSKFVSFYHFCRQITYTMNSTLTCAPHSIVTLWYPFLFFFVFIFSILVAKKVCILYMCQYTVPMYSGDRNINVSFLLIFIYVELTKQRKN